MAPVLPPQPLPQRHPFRSPLSDIIERARAHDAHGVLFKAPKPRLVYLTAAQLRGRYAPKITPERREEALARYQLDHEAISAHWDPIGVTEDLVAATGNPAWNRRRACKPCYDWDDSGDMGTLKRPNPPRAEDATESCHGCTWSYLDGANPEDLRLVERLERLRKLVHTWTKQLSTWRGQCVAMVFLKPKKWVEVPQNSSTRRWVAKKREISAARKLIDLLDRRLKSSQKVERRERSRGLVRHEFAANQPVSRAG